MLRKVAPRAFTNIDPLLKNDIVRPTILICGWLDSKHSHLLKYASIYTRLGYPVFVLESVTGDMLFNPDFLIHRKAALVFNTLQVKQIIPMVLSNGGIRSFLTFLPKLHPKVKVEAIILDSCPSILDGSRNPKAIFYQDIKRLWLKSIVLSMVSLLSKITDIYYYFYPERYILTDQFKKITTIFPDVPKLFLYSDADKAVKADHVRLAIKEMKKTSGPVDELNFVDSPHVFHFGKYQKEYEEKIHWFLKTYLCHKSKL